MLQLMCVTLHFNFFGTRLYPMCSRWFDCAQSRMVEMEKRGGVCAAHLQRKLPGNDHRALCEHLSRHCLGPWSHLAGREAQGHLIHMKFLRLNLGFRY